MKRLMVALYLLIACQAIAKGQAISNQLTWQNDIETRHKWFKSTIEEINNMGVEILKPKTFSDYVDGMFRFPENPVNVQDFYSYCLINKDSSIYIGFAVYSATSKSIEKGNLEMKILRPDWVKYDADSTWIYHTRYSADKKCSPIDFYNTEIKSLSNSDDVAEYHRIENASLLNRFYIYKTVTYHKINGGFISVSYFNLEKACIDKRLDKLIRKNRKIVRFK